MNFESTITLIGVSTIFIYCLIQILKFYGIGSETYGVYLMFYIFIIISMMILPTNYSKP